MGDKTKISWAEATWNPIRGCSKVSEGCGTGEGECYAIGVCHRNLQPHDEGLTVHIRGEGTDWTGRINRAPDSIFYKPLEWARPRRIFPTSLSDPFHENLTLEQMAEMWAVMALAHWHTFELLTKRSKRMRDVLNNPLFRPMVAEHASRIYDALPNGQARRVDRTTPASPEPPWDVPVWPLPNVWCGVSIELDKYRFRADHLRDTPAAVRWISAEPLLGPLPNLFLPRAYTPLDGGSEVPRGNDLPAGRSGAPDDRLRGAHLARELLAGQQVGQPVARDAEGAAASGEPDGQGRLLAGPGDDRQRAVSRDGAPAGVAALQRTADPRRADDQSREWGEVGQPAGESRTGDPRRADGTRTRGAQTRASGSVGAAQLDDEAHDRAGRRGPASAGGRRTAAGVGSGVRSGRDADFEDRQGDSAIAWVVVGGMSGPGAVRMDPAWALDIMEQCRGAGVAFHFKQAGVVLAREWGLSDTNGSDPDEWPAKYRIREYPRG